MKIQTFRGEIRQLKIQTMIEISRKVSIKKVDVAVSEFMQLRAARNVLNEGIKIISNDIARFKHELDEDGRASFSAGYVKTLLGGNSPVDVLCEKYNDKRQTDNGLN